MRRFRRDYPLIIRPDILLTEDGMAVTELDSVPGGFGLTQLSRVYTRLGAVVVAPRDVDGLRAICSQYKTRIW